MQVKSEQKTDLNIQYLGGAIAQLISGGEKTKIALVLMLMALGSALEALGIAIIVPFVQLISFSPESLGRSRIYVWFSHVFSFQDSIQWIVVCGVALILAYWIKNLYFAWFIRFQNRFLLNRRTRVARELLSSYLGAEYSFFLNRNSSELVWLLNSVGKLVDNVLTPTLILISESMVCFVLFLALVFHNPQVTLLAAVILFGMGALVYGSVRKKVAAWSRIQMDESIQSLKWLNQSFHGIKEVKLFGKENYYLDSYLTHYGRVSEMVHKSQTLSQLPRLVIECVLVTALLGLVLVLISSGKNIAEYTPLLALFGMAAIRLMPSLNRIMTSLMQLKEGHALVKLIDGGLKEAWRLRSARNSIEIPQKEKEEIIAFRRKISFEKVAFTYSDLNPQVLSDISFEVERGQSVAFVGPSGAGKSTIIDLLLGLLKPSSGEIRVDGIAIDRGIRSWQSRLGFVPQQIYLLDDSVRRNIAFGFADDAIDEERVQRAIQGAQLTEFIKKLPSGVHTVVGDRGIRLSGGERQRIGIARALYSDPEVMIFDEATSNLDSINEAAIHETIQRLRGEKTVILIAHRLSTVAQCDAILYVNNGKIRDRGRYDFLMKENPEFKNFACFQLMSASSAL